MHHGEFATLDLILLAAVPPILGFGIGLFLGMARGRPGRAAVAGLMGGAVGAWTGVLGYCLVVLPRVHDETIFTACVLTGFLLGAVPLGFSLGRPPDPAKAFKPLSVSFGSIFGGILGLLLGIAGAYLNIVPGSAAGMESIGYLVLPVLGGIIGVLFGIVTVLTGRVSTGV